MHHDNNRIMNRKFMGLGLGVLLLALAARALTFDQFLPYFGSSLEGNMFLFTQSMRGLDETSLYGWSVVGTGEWLRGYPPLYAWVGVLEQTLLERFTSRPWLLVNDHIYVLRVVAVVVGVITTLTVTFIAYRLAGWLGGVLAGVVWALSPQVVALDVLATPDPLVYLFGACAFAALLLAVQTGSRYAVFSVLLALILGIYTKYTIAPLLLPYGLLLLWRLRASPRNGLIDVGVAAAVGGVAAAWLVFGYGAGSLNNSEAETMVGGGWWLALQPRSLEFHLRHMLLPVGGWWALVPLFAGFAAYAVGRRRGWQTLPLFPYTYFVLVYVVGGGLLLAALGLAYSPAFDQRHTLPFTVAILPLWAAALAQLVVLIRAKLRWRGVGVGVALVIFGGVGWGWWSNAYTVYHQPHSIPLLWDYVEHLPIDGKMLVPDDEVGLALWNRPYLGYDGRKTVEWAWSGDAAQRPIDDLLTSGITYALIREETYRDTTVQPFYDQMMRVGEFPPPNVQAAGDTWYLFRVPPPQAAADAIFGGEIALRGYDLTATADALTLRLYWQPVIPPTENYSLFVHVLAADEIIAQFDGAPVNEQLLTQLWTNPAVHIIGRDVVLPLTNAPAVPLTVRIGLYNWQTGERLRLATGADVLTLVEATPLTD